MCTRNHKNSLYILAVLFVAAVIICLLYFSFLFLFLLFNIIKITNMMHYSVLISSEIWQLLVVG